MIADLNFIRRSWGNYFRTGITAPTLQSPPELGRDDLRRPTGRVSERRRAVSYRMGLAAHENATAPEGQARPPRGRMDAINRAANTVRAKDEVHAVGMHVFHFITDFLRQLGELLRQAPRAGRCTAGHVANRLGRRPAHSQPRNRVRRVQLSGLLPGEELQPIRMPRRDHEKSPSSTMQPTLLGRVSIPSRCIAIFHRCRKPAGSPAARQRKPAAGASAEGDPRHRRSEVPRHRGFTARRRDGQRQEASSGGNGNTDATA